jgi:broad specificity phosphatase PhoE
MTSRITLIAHASSEAQRHAAFPLDEPVAERELDQIAALGWKTPRAQRVLSAPELRTQQTAQSLGLSASNSVNLRDCDYGAWRGRKLHELQQSDPEGVLAWLTDPSSSPHGGESVENLIARTGCWVEEQCDVAHTIAVTHPAIIRSAIVYALHIPPQTFWRFDVAPLSLTDLRFNGRVWTFRCVGCSLRIKDQIRAWDIAMES